MRTLAIDIETFSSVDLIKSGVYAYAEAPDFTILLFGYSVDGDEPQVVDLASGEGLPGEVLAALTDPDVTKTAFNANFERTCMARYFGRPMPPEQWRCTKVRSDYLALPGSLAGAASALGLEQQKDARGSALIRYFSIPCKPTKANGMRTRNLPHHDPEKWATFKAYCAQDVAVEMAIAKRLEKFAPPEDEWRLWELDQRMNDRGWMVDAGMVFHAMACDEQYRERLVTEVVELTGLDNPNSVAQLKGWLEEATGEEIGSLNKATVKDLLAAMKDENRPSIGIDSMGVDKSQRVLEIRSELGKSSTKKYAAMEKCMCADSRVRGILQFYGANRTGRWAGRLVQVQNLPQNKMGDLDAARSILVSGDYGLLELLWGNVPDTLSQLIRTAFVAKPGHILSVADFSAIEARVIAWYAGEKWRIDVFNTHGKIYEASASQMFRLPLEAVTKGSPERQKGKVAELACGYQGGPGALKAMDAKWAATQTEAELKDLITNWRAASPNIVKFWWDVEAAAIRAVEDRTTVELQYGLAFIYEGGCLFIRLPSGRRLAYLRPKLEMDERFNKQKLTFEGTEKDSKKWGRVDTYGGKLVENIVQATARDCLAESMLALDAAGYPMVASVHDEVIIERPLDFGSLEAVCKIMGRSIPWAPGLPLRADGYETPYYKKD